MINFEIFLKYKEKHSITIGNGVKIIVVNCDYHNQSQSSSKKNNKNAPAK